MFFALWPDDDARGQLAHVADSVQWHRAARRVPPEKMHITLAFMGDTPAEQQRCFESAADEVTGAAFSLTLDHFGHFPRPRVFWFGPSEVPAALSALAEELASALQPCGFEPEHRPYRPHITLARKVIRKPIAEPVPVHWACEEFCLVESAGGRYSVLQRWQLT